MRGGCRTTCALEPVLIEEGGEGRMAELGLRQDRERRGLGLRVCARQAEEARLASCRCALSRLGSRAQTEIDAAPASGRRELEMRCLMQQHESFRLTAGTVPIPAEIRRWRAWPQRHAQIHKDAQRVAEIACSR